MVNTSSSNKAVADGAVFYYIDHAVNDRMSRYNISSKEFTSYKGSMSKHRRHSDKAYVATNGELSLEDQFDAILPKVSLRFGYSFIFYAKNWIGCSSIRDDGVPVHLSSVLRDDGGPNIHIR